MSIGKTQEVQMKMSDANTVVVGTYEEERMEERANTETRITDEETEEQQIGETDQRDLKQLQKAIDLDSIERRRDGNKRNLD
jgi:hypothetical protein